MKIEFTRAEVERILLNYANALVPCYGFDYVRGDYSFIPSTVTVEKKDAAQ
jgi:hypothetical protein